MSAYLKLGALAGLIGGIALAVFLELVGERSINDAVAFESAHATGPHHAEMFSRLTQQIGGGFGAAIYGVCLGVVFAVVFAASRHHLAGGDDWRRATALAAAAFVTVFVVPFCKYPANPPSVGDPATITRRTVLYLLMLAWSVVATWAAWRLARWLRIRRPEWAEPVRVPVVAAAYSAVVAAGWVGLPGSPDPVNAPATLVWRFRLATAGGSLVFWTVLGLSFGALAARGVTLATGNSKAHGEVLR